MMNHSDNKNCGGPFPVSDVKVPHNWEDLFSTKEEMAVLKYHSDHPNLFADKTVLHIGTGNCELVSIIAKTAKHIDSITISQAEIDRARQEYSLSNTSYFLINKHNIEELKQLTNTYDFIIDVNLKTFSCCEDHFHEFIDFVVSRLKPSGQVISALSGINFGWNGNVQRSYTPGATTEVLKNNFRILGKNGVRDICVKQNLTLSTFLVENINHKHSINLKTNPDGIIESEYLYFLTK